MKTFKTKQSKLIQIEKPLNVFWLSKFGYPKVTVFTLKKSDKDFEFAHGFNDLKELRDECQKGSDIYMEEGNLEMYNSKLNTIKESLIEFQKYNA